MASINDVAKRAHVAKSTVSLVLNDSGYVSRETREKVEQAIRDLNYTPSQLGRNLSKNKTNLIGIIVPDVAHPFYGNFVKHAEEALYQLGYKTMLCATVERKNMEQQFLDMLKNHTMDGIIMGAHSLLHEQYKHLNHPVVAFDRDLGQEIPLVQADHVQGGRIAAEFLMTQGCRKIVQVAGAKIVNTPAHKYHVSFEQTLEEHGLRAHCMEMPHNAFQEEDFARAAKELFDLYPDADGILGADLLILACMKEARKRKITTPGHVKMIAYDGTYVTRTGTHTIDAIVQPIKEMAFACAQTIDDLVKGKKPQRMLQIFPISIQKGDFLYDLHKNED